MNKADDVINEIINQLTPDTVPPKFVRLAEITSLDGTVRIVSSKEFEDIISNGVDDISSIRAILDIRKIHETIDDLVDSVMSTL